jgi:3-hydroxymyristoyl/3-hydroxydecanoyl-(acyl carrier protein) dehydratase
MKSDILYHTIEYKELYSESSDDRSSSKDSCTFKGCIHLFKFKTILIPQLCLEMEINVTAWNWNILMLSKNKEKRDSFHIRHFFARKV